MENLLKELDQLGEITANYKPYKVEDHGGLYKTFHSCSLKQDNLDISIGYNVYREKATNHMKIIEIYEKTPQYYYVTLIDLLTPQIEKMEILGENNVKKIGSLSLPEITEYLRLTNKMFMMCVPQ